MKPSLICPHPLRRRFAQLAFRAAAVFGVSALAVAAHAQRRGAPGESPAEEEQTDKGAALRTLSGTIEKVDESSFVLQPEKEDAEPISVKIDDEAAISVDGEAAEAASLKRGQVAIVTALEIKGEMYAVIVAAERGKHWDEPVRMPRVR